MIRSIHHTIAAVPSRLKLVLLALVSTALLGGCAARMGVFQYVEIEPGLQRGEAVDSPGLEIFRKYDPETSGWYEVVKNQAGEWIYTAEAEKNRAVDRRVLAETAPALEVAGASPEILRRGVVEIREIEPGLQEVVSLAGDEKVRWRRFNPETQEWYEVARAETGGFDYTTSAQSQLEADRTAERPVPDGPAAEGPGGINPRMRILLPGESPTNVAAGPAKGPVPVAGGEALLPEIGAPGSLEITALGPTWVSSVIDGAARRDFFVRQGQKVSLNWSRSLALKFGKAESVQILYDGREFPTYMQSGKTLIFPPTK